MALFLDGRTDQYPLYYPRWEMIPHYYGDIVRQLFLAIVVLMLFAAPFYTVRLSVELPFIVVGAVVIVALGGLTSPFKRWVMLMNAVASGVGIIMYESWALIGYQSGFSVAFVLRQALAVLFIFAFYFSMKTLRAMLMNIVGRRPSPEDFEGRHGGEEVDMLGKDRRGTESASVETPDVATDGLGRPAAPETDKLD